MTDISIQETENELKVRNAWNEFNKHFGRLFSKIADQKKLSMSFSWALEYKAIGEIGGRLLEDFFVRELEALNKIQEFIFFEPVHARSMGDVKCIYTQGTKNFIFYVDIKCHYANMREKTFEYYEKKGIKKKTRAIPSKHNVSRTT